MKRLFIAIVATVVLISITVISTMAQSPVNTIANSLKTGNTNTLVNYLANTVDLTILQDDDTYNKGVVANKVKTFFSQNKPSTFVVKHKMTAPNNSQKVIGTLTTQTGNYRTYLLIRNGKITELSIEN